MNGSKKMFDLGGTEVVMARTKIVHLRANSLPGDRVMARMNKRDSRDLFEWLVPSLYSVETTPSIYNIHLYQLSSL